MRLIDADKLIEKEHEIHIKEVDYRHRCIDSVEVRNAPTVQCGTCRDYLTVYCPCECKSKPNWVCGDWAERNEQ